MSVTTTNALIYPGLPGIFRGTDIPIDPQQQELFSKQMDFSSTVEGALVHGFSVLKTKANNLCLWVIFKTEDPDALKIYFEKRGVKLILNPLHSNQYMSQILYKINQIALMYRIIKDHNQFMDNSDKRFERELKALAKL